MVPLRDDNPVSTTPVVVYGIIALNVAIFFYEASLGGPALQQFINTWAVVPAELSCSLPGDALATVSDLSCPVPVDNMPAEGE